MRFNIGAQTLSTSRSLTNAISALVGYELAMVGLLRGSRHHHNSRATLAMGLLPDLHRVAATFSGFHE
jgi:hypothetical protein